MKKAVFIGKSHGRGYDRHFVFLEYEYRGHRYTVYENRAKGNEPLAWQHRSEQARIDSLIAMEERDKLRDQPPGRDPMELIGDWLDYLDGNKDWEG